MVTVGVRGRVKDMVRGRVKNSVTFTSWSIVFCNLRLVPTYSAHVSRTQLALAWSPQIIVLRIRKVVWIAFQKAFDG